MNDNERPQATYDSESGGVTGLDELFDGIFDPGELSSRKMNLMIFARTINRAMEGVPLRSILQATPEEAAQSYIDRGAFTKEDVARIFEAFGYKGYDNYPERSKRTK